MLYSRNFIKGTKEYCTIDKHVNAPLFRKTFNVGEFKKAKINICGLGLYKMYLNGNLINESIISTSIYNPDEILFYESFDIGKFLNNGKNVLAIILGNGFLNNIGAGVWSFDLAPFRDAPKFALSFEVDDKVIFEADDSFKTYPSAITFDDLRNGEFFDQRLYNEKWKDVDYDDSQWNKIFSASMPKGKITDFDDKIRIKYFQELKPVKIIKYHDTFIYDFGKCFTGFCKLKIKGDNGQRLTIRHCELLNQVNEPIFSNISFPATYKDYIQRIDYTCDGKENEYIPTFTFFCFRYAVVSGITEEQATEDLLTFQTISGDYEKRCKFVSSDKITNKIQSMVEDSDFSNMFFYPFDCAHREKNGWTADGAISIEQMLVNYDCGEMFKHWYKQIMQSQLESGKIPCVIPTFKFGFDWGSGPAWDCILVYIPIYILKYYNDVEFVKSTFSTILKYLHYLKSMVNENGLISFGLCDWCEITDDDVFGCTSELETFSSLSCIDIINKSLFLFEKFNYNEGLKFTRQFKQEILSTFREKKVDLINKKIISFTQCNQAMAIYFNVFNKEEKEKAVVELINLIKQQNEKMLVGVWGSRVLFRALADNGYQDLAFKMVSRTDEKSYGYMAMRDCNTLWEKILHLPINMRFQLSEDNTYTSFNHHFWGDISVWYIRYICGINVNPNFNNENDIVIKPHFVKDLSYAEAEFKNDNGKVWVRWERANDKVLLKVKKEGKLNVKVDCNDVEIIWL